jgi:hypothetical protein
MDPVGTVGEEGAVSDDTCIVCGRPGRLTMIGICGKCLVFAGQAFEVSVQGIKEGRVPVDSIDWSMIVDSAVRIATRSDEIDEKDDQVLEIVSNASRIAESIWTVTDEVKTALDGGEADTDRIADAINEGIAAIYGNDGASRLIQAGIRITFDLLSGDTPQEALRNLLEELLPGWMMTDLWLDQLFEPPQKPEPPPTPTFEHDFLASGAHRFQPVAEGKAECSACGIEVSLDSLGTAPPRCEAADPEVCSICGEPREGHSGEIDDEVVRRLESLAEEHLEAFRAALDGLLLELDPATTDARDRYFERLGAALDELDETEASTWLRKHARESFRASDEEMQRIRDEVMRRPADPEKHQRGQVALREWEDRWMQQVTHPYPDLPTDEMSDNDRRVLSGFGPGEPAVLVFYMKYLPDHPLYADYVANVAPYDDPAVVANESTSAINRFSSEARRFGSERGVLGYAG